MIPLYLVFPNKETALQIAKYISGAETLEELPPDGWLNGIYYNIADIGIIYDENGDPLEGYHINGLWRGGEDTIPEQLKQFMVFPETPKVTW